MAICLYRTGTSQLVRVTHVNSPGSFYVRLVNQDEDVKQLRRRGDLIPPEKVKPRMQVVYKSKTNNKYVRGEIECIKSGEEESVCTITAPDYGFRDENVDLNNLYTPLQIIKRPPLAVHCELHFCLPKGEKFDEPAIDAMKFFVGKCKNIAKVTVMCQTIDKLSVELRTIECPDDVATMLVLLNFTALSSPAYTANRFSIAADIPREISYKYKELKVGDKLCVRVLNGDMISKFYVAVPSDYKNYIHDRYEFTDYCKRQPLQDIDAAVVDRRCSGARAPQAANFERCIVEKVIQPGETAMVKYIDCGTEVEANFKDIKCVSSEVYTLEPAVAIFCSSTKEQVWKNGLPRFLYPGFEFMIEIVKLGDGMLVPHDVNISPKLNG